MLDLTDDTYGNWTVIGEADRRGYSRYWLCKCSCGNEVEVFHGTLRTGLLHVVNVVQILT